MPLSQWLTLNISTIPLAVIMIGSSILLAVITTFIAHYLLPRSNFKKHKEVVTIFFGAEAFIYSILLALVLFTSWIGFNNATLNVQKEANYLVELYRSTNAFLPEIKQEVRALLNDYTKSIIKDEWKTLQRSELNPNTTEISKNLWQTYSSYTPKTATEQVFLQESIRKLCDIRDSRITRLSDSKTGVYPLLWLVLIVGEVTTIASLNIFMEDLKAKSTMAVLFGVLVGLILFTIILFDYPFTGQFVVSPEPLRQAILYW